MRKPEILYMFCVSFTLFRPEQQNTVMSKVKIKIRKGNKPAGREVEETTAVKLVEGTDLQLLCSLPGGQGRAEVSSPMIQMFKGIMP